MVLGVTPTWQKWSNISDMIWENWEVGYTLSSGSWNSFSSNHDNQQNDLGKALGIGSQSVIGIVGWVMIWLSLINSSTMASFWSLVNECQLFFLLFLTRAFIPENVQNTITGLKFELNLSGLFPFKNIGFYSSFLKYFEFNLSNSSLDPLGFDSESTVYNASSSFFLLIFVIFLHLFVLFICKLISRLNVNGMWSRPIKVIKWLILKLYKILTFSYYIRFFIEMSQYLIISSTQEIYNLNTSKTIRTISLIFAFLVLALYISVFVLSVYLSFTRVTEGNSKLSEFYDGLKKNKKSRLYSSALLIRRALYVILLVTLESISSRAIISILVALQIVFFIYI